MGEYILQVLAPYPNVELHNLDAEHWTHVEELLTETGCTAEEVVLGIQVPIHNTPRRSSAFRGRCPTGKPGRLY